MPLGAFGGIPEADARDVARGVDGSLVMLQETACLRGSSPCSPPGRAPRRCGPRGRAPSRPPHRRGASRGRRDPPGAAA